MTVFTVANLTDIAAQTVTNVAAAGLSTYPATGAGLYVMNGVSQAMSFTLPPAAQMGNGQEVTVKRGDGSRFAINVVPSGSAQIDSATQATVSNAFGYVTLQWDGANWWIVARG